MNKIKKISSHALLSYYKEAVMDDNYNPSNEYYNQSGFTLEELENEILTRMGYLNKSEDDDDDE